MFGILLARLTRAIFFVARTRLRAFDIDHGNNRSPEFDYDQCPATEQTFIISRAIRIPWCPVVPYSLIEQVGWLHLRSKFLNTAIYRTRNHRVSAYDKTHPFSTTLTSTINDSRTNNGDRCVQTGSNWCKVQWFKFKGHVAFETIKKVVIWANTKGWWLNRPKCQGSRS